MSESPADKIVFPEYRRPAPQALLLLAALLGAGAMASFPFSVWVGLGFFIAALGCYLPWLEIDRSNQRARQAWLRSFPRHTTLSELENLPRQQTSRLVLHVKSYPGFDPKYVVPAAALLDNEAGAMIIIDPVPPDFSTRCEALGIRIIAA